MLIAMTGYGGELTNTHPACWIRSFPRQAGKPVSIKEKLASRRPS